MTRLRAKSAFAVLCVLATAAAAWAYWTTSGTGSGEASVGNLTAPDLSVPGTSSGSHALAWTAASTGDPSIDDEITYTVERKLEVGGTFTPVATGSCSGELPPTTGGCTDTVTASGNYFYRVIASVRSWTASSNEAGPVVATVGPVDTTAPYVVSIDRVDPSPTNAASVDWTVTFSEDVTGVDATDFDTVGSVASPFVTGVTPAGPADTYTVTADTGSGSGMLRLDLDDDNSIEDGAANDLVGPPPTSDPNGDSTGEEYAIDKTPPQVQSIERYDPTSSLTNVSAVKWEIKFSESVSNVNLADFALNQGAGLTGSTLANVVQVDGSTYRVEANTGSGDGNLNLNVADDDSIEDGVGNALGGTGTTGGGNGSFTGGAASEYHIDKIGPTVQSIAAGDPNPTNANSVSWTVTFDDSSIQGVNDGDFALTTTGVSGAAITDVSAITGQQYTVTASTGAGDGTIRLDLVDNDSITDQIGNPLGGPGTTGGGNGSFQGVSAVYTIDRTGPRVQSINRDDSDPTGAATVHWTATFTEPVEDVGTGDFALAQGGGVSGANITGVSAISPSGGFATSYTVTATTGSGSGTLGLNLNDDDSINDQSTNVLQGVSDADGSFTGQSYTIDRTAPSLTTLEMFDVDQDGKVDQAKATFNETLGSYSAPDSVWTLVDVPSGGSLASVSVSGSVATLAIAEGAGAADTTVGTFKIALAANAAGVRDTHGNQSSFAATAPDDKAAPAPTTVEMFDTEATPDGKVDQAEVTFSEDLNTPYTAANGVWTLANAPGGAGNTLNSVSVATNVATLTLDEGNINTAAGTYSGATLTNFTLALAADAGGIRDAANNQTSFSARNVADKAKPIVATVSTANSGTAGRVTQGDTFTVLYSENLSSSTICSAWSDDVNASELRSNNTTVTVTNGGASNDTLTVTDGSCTINVGTINLGSTGYVTGSGNANFVANPNASRSVVNWDPATRTLVITVGARGGGGGAGGSGTISTVASSVITLTPDTVTDLAGPPANAITGSFATGNVQQF